MKVLLLDEAYTGGDIYHATHVNKAIEIMKYNIIKATQDEDNYCKAQGLGYFGKPTVSFTRDKYKILSLPQWNGIEFVVFVVDSLKLSYDYKLIPFSYDGIKYEPFNKKRMKEKKEKELRKRQQASFSDSEPFSLDDMDDIDLPFENYHYSFNEQKDKDDVIIGDIRKESEIVTIKDIKNFNQYVKWVEVDSRVADNDYNKKFYKQSMTYRDVFENHLQGKGSNFVNQNIKNSEGIVSFEEFKDYCIEKKFGGIKIYKK